MNFHFSRHIVRLTALAIAITGIGMAITACTLPTGTQTTDQELIEAQARIEELTQTLAELQAEHDEHLHDAHADHAHEEHAHESHTSSGATAQAEGIVYAFAPGKIAIIDPANARVLGEITDGLEGVEWADVLVIPDQQRIFANDRAGAQVLVIDTVEQAIIAHVDVGPRPVHMYHPLGGSEIWTHSDEEGAFYIIDIETLNVPARVVAANQDTGHGKLLYHEALGSKAYATNTNDPAVFVIDMEAKTVIGTIDLCEGEGGTHAKAFTAANGYAYFECSALGQVAMVDTATDTLAGYLDGAGQLFESPDGTLAVIMDKANGLVRVIDGENTPRIIGEIEVSGGADQLAFFMHDDTLWGFTANTLSPDTAVIDLNAMTLVKRIAAGDIARPEGASFFHRTGIVAGGYFITPASGDGIVALVDVENQTLHAAIPVGAGVSHVAYVETSSP